MRLINRNKQVPGGMKFYCPFLKWSSQPWASFAVICDGLRNARLANPGVTKANNLATDANQIAEEVDAYVAANCAALGQTDYITGAGGAPVPFHQGQPRPLNPLQRARNVAAGSKTIVQWIASKEQAVPAELSAKRAATCVACPLNQPPNWTEKFTVAVAAAIKEALAVKEGWSLTTPDDAKLGICGGCSCVNALSVHCPLDIKLANMPKEAFDALDAKCWVRLEKAA